MVWKAAIDVCMHECIFWETKNGCGFLLLLACLLPSRDGKLGLGKEKGEWGMGREMN